MTPTETLVHLRVLTDPTPQSILEALAAAGYVVCPVAFPQMPQNDLVAVPRALIVGSGKVAAAKGEA